MPDAQELRRRAFAALRELLARLGDRCRLILFLDDLQWGDLDSGLLLAELVRPPDAAGAAVAGRLPRRGRRHQPLRPRLRASRDQADSNPDRCELTVEALDAVEARDLARVLLGPTASADQLETIARESAGNPLFVQELVQHLQTDRCGDRFVRDARSGVVGRASNACRRTSGGSWRSWPWRGGL